jgi:hypothetical protein
VSTGRGSNIIVGVQAGENIAVWALAVGQKLQIGAFAGLVAPS